MHSLAEEERETRLYRQIETRLNDIEIDEHGMYKVGMNATDVKAVELLVRCLLSPKHSQKKLRLRFYSASIVFPEVMWDLANLEELIFDCPDDDIKEFIPPTINKLVGLKKLTVEDYSSETFPENVCLLEHLQELHMFRCDLGTLPSSFAFLRNLLELDLEHNSFNKFPEVICQLRNLRKLKLGANQLSSLPRSFANLRDLRFLDMSGNHFKEFPIVLCELLNLETLWMEMNQLSELPLAITKLVNLVYIHLAHNCLIRLPVFLGDLPNLKSVNRFESDRLRYLQQRKEIVRLTVIITGGFCAPNDTNPWTKFLVRGLYDPRLFLIIFDFAFEETSRKKFRAE